MASCIILRHIDMFSAIAVSLYPPSLDVLQATSIALKQVFVMFDIPSMIKIMNYHATVSQYSVRLEGLGLLRVVIHTPVISLTICKYNVM